MSDHGTRWYLMMQQGPNPGEVYPVGGQGVTIGRSADNDIAIDDPRVSRHHARLMARDQAMMITDLGSANGTRVNQTKIAGPVRLRNGDMIELGRGIALVFSDWAQAKETDPAEQPTIFEAAPPAPVVSARHEARPAPPPPKNNFLFLGVGSLIAIVIVGLVAIIAALLLYRSGPDLTASAPTATDTVAPPPTEVPPTYTPYPTYTPAPTEPPTATPYPTYTPVPTNVPTATPYPTYTPYPTPIPTATPYPTYTPQPTSRPVVIVQQAPTQAPTDTPPPQPPTATPPPPFILSLGQNVGYEPWGKPGDPDGCGPPYDDRIEVRRFTVQVLLTNNSDQYIGENWWPTFLSGSGAGVPSCWFYYNNVVVEPGETVDVTYATYLPKGDYVKALVFDILGQTHTLCLNPGGQQIPCR